MKYRPLSADEIERKDKRLRRTIVTLAVFLLLLQMIDYGVRVHTYKSVIYDYERESQVAEKADDDSPIVRNVGKPNKPYYLLPKRPRYRRFWWGY